MRRCFKSVVHVRANERTAALVALYTLHSGAIALLATVDAFRMIDAPSGNSGSAFCTVKSRPFTLMSKIASQCSSVILPKGGVLRNAGIGEHNIELALLPLDLREEAIKIAQVRHVSLYAGHVCTDLLYRSSQLPITATRYEHVRAFVHELLRRRKTNAAIATGNQCNFSFKLGHGVLHQS